MINFRLWQQPPAWIDKASGVGFVLFAASSAFLTYFSMYAFRKPFSVNSYDAYNNSDWLVSFKVALILAQVFGYLCAKLVGVKVIAEMQPSRRVYAILGMILSAELALVLFALTPNGINVVWLFVNGLSLGMIWGLVFSYLEGRKTTEILGAVLSVTFILASGLVRTVGQWLVVELDVHELWMPAVTGAVFLPLLFLSVLCLNSIPKPTQEDELARQKRAPMSGKARWQFFKRYWFGILALVLSFLLFTGFRDFRDNFSAEIWHALGYGHEPTIFAYAGIRIAFFVLLAMAALVLIKKNRTAFFANHYFILLGILLLAGSTYGYESQWLSSKAWMVLLGAGLYISYIPYNCFLFDRLISAVGSTANAGFLIYLADSAGYIGSVGILLYKTFATPELSWLQFFVSACYWISAIAGVLVISAFIYFKTQLLSTQKISTRNIEIASS
ncbi:DUF5690 family protein [Pseudoalteromonas luteoviolacea]|uniref:Membrane protein n=1 Tax=Pseudoalteromonas luteoviolacea DSM 6061 TaxID=1365250 RepID=A0A166WUA9_9GAMM|nr:DUF5690 family protein [Pseudoalteromonas luteoviolacea]KZN38087.1 membrane protein [Pseudoalteromonas luteoviolacea DSM 6061]MBE0388894.1 hypothetical protein [Pseudoalteromonas luteoviolacea DSM 6061]